MQNCLLLQKKPALLDQILAVPIRESASTLCHSKKSLDCVPGIHFWEKTEGNKPNILSTSSSQMWNMVNVLSTVPGMERTVIFCDKHQKDKSGHCCPAFSCPHCHTSFYLYPGHGRKPSTASGPTRIPKKTL